MANDLAGVRREADRDIRFAAQPRHVDIGFARDAEHDPFDASGLLRRQSDHFDADRNHPARNLLLAIGNLDEFIKMIRDSSSKDEAASRIKACTFTVEAAQALGILIRGQASVRDGQYILTDRQVEHILELRLYQLTALERHKLKDEYDALLSNISDLLDILAKEQRVLNIIKDELRAVAASPERLAAARRRAAAACSGQRAGGG